MSVDLRSLTREQLEQRRNELHVQLAAVNDRLFAMRATRNGDLARGRFAIEEVPELCHAGQHAFRVSLRGEETPAATPLDPSDPPA